VASESDVFYFKAMLESVQSDISAARNRFEELQSHRDYAAFRETSEYARLGTYFMIMSADFARLLALTDTAVRRLETHI
jgi:hypothetical protein